MFIWEKLLFYFNGVNISLLRTDEPIRDTINQICKGIGLAKQDQRKHGNMPVAPARVFTKKIQKEKKSIMRKTSHLMFPLLSKNKKASREKQKFQSSLVLSQGESLAKNQPSKQCKEFNSPFHIFLLLVLLPKITKIFPTIIFPARKNYEAK